MNWHSLDASGPDQSDDGNFFLTPQHIIYSPNLVPLDKPTNGCEVVDRPETISCSDPQGSPSLNRPGVQPVRLVSVVAPFSARLTYSHGEANCRACNNNNRIQHTLSSIASQKPRSRDPIVDISSRRPNLVRTTLRRRLQLQHPRDMSNFESSERNATKPIAPNRRSFITTTTRSNLIELNPVQHNAQPNSYTADVQHTGNTSGSYLSMGEVELLTSAQAEPQSRATLNSVAKNDSSTSVSTLESHRHDPLGSLDRALASMDSDIPMMQNDEFMPGASSTRSSIRQPLQVESGESDTIRQRSIRSCSMQDGNEKLPLGSKPLSSSSSNGVYSSSSASSSSSKLAGDSSRRHLGDACARQLEISNGFEIAWLDFTYSIEPNIFEDPRWGIVNKLFHKERRMILKGLSGGLKSGQMVALMGPSGAGKTCLLESISGVRTSGLGGRLCLRGRKRAQLAIVPQYDVFLPQFSVEETVVYGSRMKNPASTNHRQVANSIIEQLGLQSCRHNNIQRCSGGQRKRVAIAQELVSKPNILVLDEPTSGLDSSCCYHTMKVLRDVLDQSVRTNEPMAIVSTIHQPSAKVFKMFDLIYLLGKTGYLAYSGPPDDLLPTISDVAGLECPKYSNPSDFMIELVAYDYGEEPVERLIEFERQKASQFVKDFDRRSGWPPASSSSSFLVVPSSQSSVNESIATVRTLPCGASEENCAVSERAPNGSSRAASVKSLSMAPRLASSKSDTHLAQNNRLDQIQQRLKASDLMSDMTHVAYKNNVTVSLKKATSNEDRHHPFLWHSWVHMHRSFLQAIRDPILNNMRILIHLGFATMLVLMYGEMSGEARGCPPVLGLPTEITNPNSEQMIDLADNVGYLFQCIMLITYVSLMSTVLTFPIDIKTVSKEYRNGWYGTFSYFVGKSIADLPFIIVYPVVYCLIVWFATHQGRDHWWRFFSFNGLIILNAMCSQSFGLILGALFVNSVTAATFLGPVITIPWYLFTGFTKRVHRLGEPFRSMSRFLFTRHIFEGILDTVYGHQRCNCTEFVRQYQELRFEEASRLGQMISVETLSSLDYYDGLDTVADVVNETLFPPKGSGGPNWFERTMDAASTVFANGDELDLASLMETNVKASSMFSFGLDYEPSCPSDYETFVVQDFRLRDRTFDKSILVVFAMLCCIRFITFILVAWKIRTRQ